MSAENSIEPLGIDLEAWRQEVETFAEKTKQSLNSIGDMLLTASYEIDSKTVEEEEEEEAPGETTVLPETKEQTGGGRLDQLRAKLAQKISEKNN